MEYREYPSNKTYIVVHKTGFGVVESPYLEKEVVYESNSLKVAQKKADELEVQNNSTEEIKSSWVSNTYWININTTTKQGKKLLEKFGKEFDRQMEKVNWENCTAYKTGCQTVYFEHCEAFEALLRPPPTRIIYSVPKKRKVDIDDLPF